MALEIESRGTVCGSIQQQTFTITLSSGIIILSSFQLMIFQLECSKTWRKKAFHTRKIKAWESMDHFWNADDWATQGGRVKTNWSHSPFVTTFQSFEIDACDLSGEDKIAAGAKCGKLAQFLWDKPILKGLEKSKKSQFKMVQSKYLVYDYCKDTARFTQMPIECLY